MHVMTKGFCGDMAIANIAWHTRIVVGLMNSAKGDLMLDRFGNLTTRVTFDMDAFKDLPFEQHRAGETLALIGADGWVLTNEGANWILENCPPCNKRDAKVMQHMTRDMLAQRFSRGAIG